MKWLLQKSHVSRTIEHRLGEMLSEYSTIILSDKQYRTVPISWISNRITSDEVLSASYTEDIFDCEDMAFYLRTAASLFSLSNGHDAPMAIGVLLTRFHAFNICIDDSRALSIIDTTYFSDRGYTRKKEDFWKFLSLDEEGNYIRLIFI